MAIIVGDQIHRQTQVAESSRPADAVEVCLGVLGEIEVDDHVDALDVDTASEEIGRHEMAGAAVAEFVEDTVTIRLLHLGMDIEAGVSEFGDLLRQELDAIDRVAEDDRLIDLELGEEGVEAVDLLPFLDVGVKLGDSPKGELLHQVDGIWLGDVLLAEFLDGHREGGTEETDLMRLVAKFNQFLKDGLEFGGKEFVCLVHDDGTAFAKIRDLSRGQIQNTAGGGDNHVHGIVHAHDIILERCSSRGYHALNSHVLPDFLDDGRCLQR